jgi:hypothetical protein
MSTSPGGGTEAAALKRETVPRPRAWRIRQTEIARFAAAGKRCETRKCREPVTIVTWRWWRSAAASCVLLSEREVCERHGTGFAAQHHIGVDPAGEIVARHPSDAGMAALEAEARHCDWPACGVVATWIFTESYTVRGEPRADEDLSCDRHVRAFADRFNISVTGEEGVR